MAARSVLDRVLEALSQQTLFTKINLLACQPVSTLSKFNSSAPITQLKRLFGEAFLEPRIGFNQGSGDISLSVSLPLEEQPVATPQQVVLWYLLGIYHNQEEVERLYKEEKKGNGDELLINRCLSLFMDQSQIAFTSRKKDFRLSFVTLRLDTFQKKITQKDGTLYTDNMKVPYKYSPNYWLFSGYDPEKKEYSEDFLSLQKEKFVEEMVKEFWALVVSKHYFPDPNLKEQVSSFLLNYIKEGICDEEERFSPHQKALALYLYGTAGCGKSSFVRLFTQVFGKIIAKHLEPRKRSSLVKVPLNCITAPDLRKILHVRGISDWSVERIVEQTIARSGIALLHLEENPEEEDLQDELFTLSQSMLKSVTNRYPEYSSNLLYIITSNYRASPYLSQQAKEITMSPPQANVQLEWCNQTLGDCIKRTLIEKEKRIQDARSMKALLREAKHQQEGSQQEEKTSSPTSPVVPPAALSSPLSPACLSPTLSPTMLQAETPLTDYIIEVELTKAPPVTRDMRILEKWKMSLDFFISNHIFKALRKRSETQEKSGEKEVAANERDRKIHITIAGSVPKFLQISFKVSGTTKAFQIPLLTLKSHDDYFYFSPELCTPGESDDEEERSDDSLEDFSKDTTTNIDVDPRNEAAPLIPGIQHDHATRVWTVVEMMKKLYLKPGVIVLANRCAQRGRDRRIVSDQRSEGERREGDRLDDSTSDRSTSARRSESERSGSERRSESARRIENEGAESTMKNENHQNNRAAIADAKKDRCEANLIDFMYKIFGQKNLHVTNITAKTDKDKEAIFGNPSSPILGGLLAFIDNITSTVYKRDKEFVLICVDANELGQFMLREMLEGGNSETHRVRVKKERVLFLVKVEGQVSPQMESRAHHTLLF